MLIALFGRINTPLRKDSPVTETSSAIIVNGSSQHQGPTLEHHPIIEPEIQAPFSIFDLFKTTEFFILTPGPITQFSPIETFGPNKADGSTFAVGWIITFPVTYDSWQRLLSFLSSRNLR